MNTDELGYFIYMTEQEEKQQEHIEVHVNYDDNLVGELAPSKEDQDKE